MIFKSSFVRPPRAAGSQLSSATSQVFKSCVEQIGNAWSFEPIFILLQLIFYGARSKRFFTFIRLLAITIGVDDDDAQGI